MSDFNENQKNEQTNMSDGFSAQSPAFAETQFVGGAEPAKKKPVLLIIAVIVILLAGGCALAYNFIPWVKNNVKMLINDPEEYYLWVEEENLGEMADAVSDAYGKGLSAANINNSQEIELKADLDSTNVGAFIEELTGSPLSDSGVVIPSSIAVKSGAVKDDANLKGSCLISAGDSTLATLNIYLQDGKYYVQIPEISSAYICADLNAIMESAADDMDSDDAAFMKGYMDAVTGISSDPEALEEMLSEDELNDLIVRYFTLAFENIDDVEIEKGVACDANGVEKEYNQLIANVDMGSAYSILKDVLNEAKNDATIIKIVEKFGLSKDDYTAAIEEVLGQLGTLEMSGGETIFTMNVYVDSKGKICGRDIKVPDAENVEIGYMTVEDGSDTGIDVKVMSDGEGIQVIGKETEKSGKQDGEVKVILAGMNDDGTNIEVPVKYEDCEVVDELKGYIKGKYTADLTAYGMPAISFDFDSDGKGQTVKSDITVDGKNYAAITLTTKEDVTIDIPEFDSAQKVYQTTDEDMEHYFTESNVGLVNFLNNIGSAFGVDGIGSIFGAALTADDTTGDDVLTDDSDITDMTGLASETSVYDFSKLNIQINGQSVKFPSKINNLSSLVKVEDQQIEANGFTAYYSEDYTFGVTLMNDTDKAAAPAECKVTGFSLSAGSAVPASIDGFTAGSNIADFAAKYGVKIADPSNGEVTLTDSSSAWNSLTVYYYDGKIDSMYIDVME